MGDMKPCRWRSKSGVFRSGYRCSAGGQDVRHIRPCPGTCDVREYVERLEEALRFYADPESYEPLGMGPSLIEQDIENGYGLVAQEALKQAGM